MAERLKNATLNLRVEAEKKAAWDEAARLDGRTLTNLIEKLLNDFARRKGTLKEPRK